MPARDPQDRAARDVLAASVRLQRAGNTLGRHARGWSATGIEAVGLLATLDPWDVSFVWGRKRLDKWLGVLWPVWLKQSRDLATALVKDAERLAVTEYRWAAQSVDVSPPDAAVLRRKASEWARAEVQGATARDWVQATGRNTYQEVTRLTRLAWTEGAEEARIRGIVRTAAARARRLTALNTRTLAAHVTSRAHVEVWGRSGADRVYYAAVLDSRTSPICRALSGRTWNISDPAIRYPPQHIGCRSLLMPVEPQGEKGYRLPPRFRYGEWLRKQSRAVQDEILGPSRGTLWRTGKVSLAQMVRADGTLLRLDELKT